MYEIGKIYIWQNLTGANFVLNGTECTVTSGKRVYRNLVTGEIFVAQETDTRSARRPGVLLVAMRGELRPKNPPSGERRVMEMFNKCLAVWRPRSEVLQ